MKGGMVRRIAPWALVVLVLGAGAASVLVIGRDGGHSTPVIVDYSPTLSDVPALLYVAARPDVDLLAVTLPGTGESSCAVGVRYTRQLLALVGRGDVPVGCGREQPLAGDRDWPEEWRRSADTLTGPVLPDVPEVPAPDAVDLLVETIAASEAPVTVLTLSVLTVASGIPLTLVPLDATDDVPGNRRLIARAQSAQGHPAGVAAAQLWNANVDAVAGEGFYFWDELAAAVAFEPDLVTLETRTIVASKDLGATVDDPDGTPVLLATSADQGRFEQHLLDILNGSPVPPPAPLSEAERAYGETLESAFDVALEARKETWSAWSAEPAPGAEPLDVARAGVAAMWGGLRTLDETLASADPPPAYAEAHDEMRAALGELLGLGLEADAVAALDTPEAASAEEPSLLLQAAVGRRFEEIAGRFTAPCNGIANDLLLRDGPELTCVL